MSKPIDKELLAKYSRGQCNAQEEAMVHQWLDENDAGQYPDAHSDFKYGRKMRGMWEKLTDQVEGLQLAGPLENKHNQRRTWAIAASIAVLLGLAAYFYRPIFSQTAAAYAATYQTNYGEVKRITLEDGTAVTLNARSTLQVSRNYNDRNRLVYLSGEAYFTVKQQEALPFEVQTTKLSVTALGTAFDVSAFPEDSQMTVSLAEGSVLVKTPEEKPNNNLILTKGEGAIYKERSGLVKKAQFNARVNFAWQHQIIAFEDADMQEVVQKLERFYGVKFDTTRLKTRHWHLTGEYQSQSLRDVLESLRFNYNLRYQIQEDRVILSEP